MVGIRKNAKPKWFTYNNSYCLSCGENFNQNEKIVSGFYCSNCGPKKEIEMHINKIQVDWYEYRNVCVKCANIFSKGEQILFGVYCTKCGKKWIKEQGIRKARLKKARSF